jgi:MFS transporter, DHA1 family, tetracycline resistance protein
MNKTIKEDKFSILPIFLVVLIDMIGIGIVIPVLGPLFLSTNIFFDVSVGFMQRAVVLGFLLASFAIAQFFGGPLLGALSDRHGRKKYLIISLAGTLIGYVLFALGIIYHSLLLLFIGRIIDGFTGGNITIAMSALADVSDEKQKVKRFGLIGMAFGVGVIIGPLIGGLLADSSVVSWFNHATPFWFAAILCLTNIIFLTYNFKETLAHPRRTEVSLTKGVHNIIRALHTGQLRFLFITLFLFSLGFSFFTQFFQVFLITKFSFQEHDIGLFFAFMGLCIAITQGLIVRPLSKKYHPEQIMSYSLLLMSVVMIVYLIPTNPAWLYAIVPFMSFANGLTMPNSSALTSNLSPKDMQGEILGINQSFTSLGMAIPPIIAGLVSGISYTLPIILGSITIFTAWIVFTFVFKPKIPALRERREHNS